jgi:hypothetical protein
LLAGRVWAFLNEEKSQTLKNLQSQFAIQIEKKSYSQGAFVVSVRYFFLHYFTSLSPPV